MARLTGQEVLKWCRLPVTPSDFVFVGNHAAVDFVNTELIEAARRVDLLRSDADLFRWARGAGLLERASATPASKRLHPSVRPLRAAIRLLLTAQLDRAAPPQAALARLNGILTRRPVVAPLDHRGGRFVRPAPALASTRELLTRIAEVAAQLLTSNEAAQLRACANSGCILLFVDRSKAGQRRWCSMQVCGNRAKVAAHHRREQQTESASGEKIRARRRP
jgi:predicted RNA-binding Zn ribbon-like protein